MSETTDFHAQLPATEAIEKLTYQAMSSNWFEYPILVYPHHTDYAGIGIDFADLVALGCDLPVVDLSIRYRQSLRMGESAIVKTRTIEMEGVRIVWEYEIQSADRKIIYLTGMVTLVAVDLEKGKIMRQLPTTVKDALVKMRE